MTETIAYKDMKGNVYERADCDGCHVCDLEDSCMDCLNAPCKPGKGWKLVGEKIPDIEKTLWAAVAVCSQMRGSVCDLAGSPCSYWVETACPLRKHLAALGDKKAWRVK